jgi:uncharacterized protein YndB with AHSA1/START domain
MFKTILIWGAVVIAVLAGGVLAYAATKPDTFRLQRTATINAPPQTVFAMINDYRNWTAWSPWEKKDPNLKRTYSEPSSGKGATYAWEGDKNVGKGSMLITEATPASRVALNLDFEKPFQAHNKVVFDLDSKGLTTDVTWSMEGPTPFFAKLIHVFIDMDKMVGKDFEAGLAAMKAAAEKQVAAR